MALFRRLKPPYAEEPPAGGAAPPSGPRSAGDVLRQRREGLGLDLDDVAAALEAGRPELLPGPTYAIGFVRAYSDHLGLDGSEILRRFKAESAGLDVKPDLAFPMPLGERSIPGKAMLLVALILMLCAYGTWYYLATDERSRPERVAELPIGLLPPPPTQRASEGAAPPSAAAPAETPTAAAADNNFRATIQAGSEPSTSREPAAGAAVISGETAPAPSAPVPVLPPAPPPPVL